jgi:hypothetical protein
MPYFAADFAQPLVPQLGFPITRRSDSLKKPYEKAAPGDLRARPLRQFKVRRCHRIHLHLSHWER